MKSESRYYWAVSTLFKFTTILEYCNGYYYVLGNPIIIPEKDLDEHGYALCNEIIKPEHLE